MTSAKLYMSQHNYDRADTALTKEVAKNPQNSEAWYLLGRIKLEQGNIPLMVDYFDKSLAAGKEFEKDITDAKKYAWQISLNRGAALYNRAMALKKVPATAGNDSIQIYLGQSVDAYRVALKANPDSAMTYENMSIAQYSGDKYDDELVTLKEGLQRTHQAMFDTMIIDAYRAKLDNINQKIFTLEKAGKKTETTPLYQEAITTINTARKDYPSDLDLIAIQTDFYVRSGRANEAKPTIREAIAKEPGNKLNHYNLGVLLMQTDSLTTAIKEFEAALAIDPKYDVALQNCAVAYMKLGDKVRKANQDAGSKKDPDKSYIDSFKKAAGYFETLTAIKPGDPNLWDSLASAYANAGMVKKAEEAIKKADAIRKK
ncbi:MAG TPA: tetratricopeptide repeat protein [Bacteroidota bacterium]|nr:tetratricopeptide repeat protein [Bacteroidota bacterium]